MRLSMCYILGGKMKLTEKELNSYRTAVWNLLCSLEQGWANYKQKICELKQIDKQLFDNTNITNAMHSDGKGNAVRIGKTLKDMCKM